MEASLDNSCGVELLITVGGEEAIKDFAIAEMYHTLRLRFKFLSVQFLKEKAADIVQEKNEQLWQMLIFKVWESNENSDPDRTYSLYRFFSAHQYSAYEKNIEHYHIALEHFYRGLWISRYWPAPTRKLHAFDEIVDVVNLIENVSLLKTYEDEKMRFQYEEKNYKELLLFHGTSPGALKNILRYG